MVVAITDGEAVGLRRAVREVEEALAGGHGGGDSIAVILAEGAARLAMPHLRQPAGVVRATSAWSRLLAGWGGVGWGGDLVVRGLAVGHRLRNGGAPHGVEARADHLAAHQAIDEPDHGPAEQRCVEARSL